MVVHLRRKVISLGLINFSDQTGMLLTVMHMMRQRPLIVEKLGIHGLVRILLPEAFTNQRPFKFGNSVPQ